MKNTDIFTDYDMVVSVTEATINDQLKHLVRLGTIHRTLVLQQHIEQTPAPAHYVYEVLDSPASLDEHNAYINATLVVPQVSITESGTTIQFTLEFGSGTANFWVGSGPLASLQQYDMAGWKYSIVCDMGLAELAHVDSAAGVAIPDHVKAQLREFQNAMFRVDHLFVDFESTNLLRFDPTSTDAGDAGDPGIESLTQFMQFYLKSLVTNGNPYILGYAVTTDNDTTFDDTTKIPDEIKPVGTTYSMYHDPHHQALSNLNFVMVTKGGHGTAGISTSPGNFDTNWIGATETCDAKMIYSHARLIEPLILKPFYDGLRTSVYKEIKGSISVPEGNTYDQGKAVTSTGYGYTISDVTAGDNRYTNTFTVDFSNTTGKTTLTLNGAISAYKMNRKEMPTCEATAWAKGSTTWTGSIDLVTSHDATNKPELTIKHSFTPGTPSKSSKKNDCAKAWQTIGEILDDILSTLTFGITGIFFSDLIENLLSTDVPGVGNLSVATAAIGNSVGSAVLLPAGQVFYFTDAASDTEGNLNMELTYQSDTSSS